MGECGRSAGAHDSLGYNGSPLALVLPLRKGVLGRSSSSSSSAGGVPIGGGVGIDSTFGGEMSAGPDGDEFEERRRKETCQG